MSSYLKLSLRIFLCVCLFSFALISYAQQTTPVGFWKQVSDQAGMQGQVRSIIKISQVNEQLIGTIVKTYTVNGIKPETYCKDCPDDFKNKPIIGLKILWGMQQVDSNSWEDGKILDPKSGNIYSCRLTLLNEGTQLKVRGYIGISLLGRTQVWQRMTPAEIVALSNSK